MLYKVVKNHAQQYAIWPRDKANAPGWVDAGPSGSRETCLAYVKAVWTDLRPRRPRTHREEGASG